jgi:hypothetical protein
LYKKREGNLETDDPLHGNEGGLCEGGGGVKKEKKNVELISNLASKTSAFELKGHLP